jgi:hypothetical protein
MSLICIIMFQVAKYEIPFTYFLLFCFLILLLHSSDLYLQNDRQADCFVTEELCC